MSNDMRYYNKPFVNKNWILTLVVKARQTLMAIVVTPLKRAAARVALSKNGKLIDFILLFILSFILL